MSDKDYPPNKVPRLDSYKPPIHPNNFHFIPNYNNNSREFNTNTNQNKELIKTQTETRTKTENDMIKKAIIEFNL